MRSYEFAGSSGKPRGQICIRGIIYILHNPSDKIFILLPTAYARFLGHFCRRTPETMFAAIVRGQGAPKSVENGSRRSINVESLS